MAKENRMLKPSAQCTADTSLEHVINGMVARSNGGTVMMPPGIAKRILEELNFVGQRKINEARVIKHRRRIESGLWRGSFPITFAVLPSGSMLLIDGQHRTKAIVEIGAPQPVTVIFAKVGTEAEARRLYAGFDEPDSKRTSGEVIDAVGLSGQVGLPRAFTSRLYNALPILRNGLEVATGSEIEPEKYVSLFSTDSRLAEITAWRNEAEKYLECVQKTTGRVRAKLQSAGCMAVALYTFRHQPAKAHQFWNGLAENDALSKFDPRAALIRDMFERTASHGSARQTVQAPTLAWNAWCEGRELRIIKCITGSAITVWGTPIAKGRA